MSNVLKRNRNLSDFEFYKNAIKIRSEVIAITNNEKYIPKRRRITIGNRTLGHALDLVEYISKANSSFPSTPEMLFIRKWYQQRAISECEALIESIRVIIELQKIGKTNRLMQVVYFVTSEIELLKRWMRATKITKHSKKYLKQPDNPTNNIDSDVPNNESETNNANTTNTSPQNDALTDDDRSVRNLLVMLMVLLESTSKYDDLV